MNLYVAQYVICNEELWFDRGNRSLPVRSEKTYYLKSYLFAAPHRDRAYELAVEWLDGQGDAHHDGAGELTRYYAIGLHNIEDLQLTLANLQEEVTGDYGADVGRYEPDMIDANGIPILREKSALDIFQTFE